MCLSQLPTVRSAAGPQEHRRLSARAPDGSVGLEIVGILFPATGTILLLRFMPLRPKKPLPSDMGLRRLLAPLGQRPAEVLLLGPSDDVFAAA
jgi:hypothetical protein